MTGDSPARRRAWTGVTAALVAYLILAALYTSPLLGRSRTAVASDRYDPVLNASILWWNATTIPFSSAWWTPPHYFPSEGIAAFTEHLVGVGVIASPLYWLTGDPLLTYNLVFFLSWPLCAFSVYLLVWRLARRHDAALIAGLAFGFAPYRVAQMAHLQVLSCYWLPLALAALHGFLVDRRRRWLVLFGGAWLLQSLANGYFMLFGAVLIALWLAYFCSTRETWRLVFPVLVAWVVASLPLVPVLLKYRAIHEQYGLGRSLAEVIMYSARPSAWWSTPDLIWFWRATLPDAGGEANLFPGLTVCLIVAAACLGRVFMSFRRTGAHETHAGEPRWRPRVRVALGLLLTLSGAAILSMLVLGPWRATLLGVVVRMSHIDRAAVVAIISAAGLVMLRTPAAHRWQRRSVFAFYVFATLAIAVLCLGPQIRVGSRVLVDAAPYRLLLYLPGFDGLRVPTRFWMLGALCLATAGGMGFARLVPPAARVRLPLLLLVSAGIMLDGWLSVMPMGRAPEFWPRVERGDSESAVLELPLGPEWDAAATYRAVRHRRRVVNGVSGYDPPHYALLQRGLNARDPAMLLALASLGPLDVVVDGSQDPDGSLERYVAGVAGAERLATDGVRTVYRLPSSEGHPSALGEALPVSSVRDSDGADLPAVLDGNPETAWADAPQSPDLWILVDLGAPREIGAVVQALGRSVEAYPRQLAIEVSTDGARWETAWSGAGLERAFLAAVREPREAGMVFRFAPAVARYVRLRPAAADASAWSVAELRVHAPAGR